MFEVLRTFIVIDLGIRFGQEDARLGCFLRQNIVSKPSQQLHIYKLSFYALGFSEVDGGRIKNV